MCAQGYFVWAKLIEALADLGYDANNIVSGPHPRSPSFCPPLLGRGQPRAITGESRRL